MPPLLLQPGNETYEPLGWSLADEGTIMIDLYGQLTHNAGNVGLPIRRLRFDLDFGRESNLFISVSIADLP